MFKRVTGDGRNPKNVELNKFEKKQCSIHLLDLYNFRLQQTDDHCLQGSRTIVAGWSCGKHENDRNPHNY